MRAIPRRRLVRSLVPLLAGGAALFLAPPSRATAQDADISWTPGRYLVQAIGRVYGQAARAVEVGYGFENGVSLLGSYIRRGGTTTLVRELEEGVDYGFVGGGDNDVLDVDLVLLDEYGNKVAGDTSEDAIPVFSYRPRRTGKYTLQLSLPRAAAHSFCAVAILKRNGWKVSPELLARAAGNLVQAGMVINKQYKSGLLAESNSWAVWGGVTNANSHVSLSNVAMGTGARVVIASSDIDDGDVDVTVETVSGQEVGKDDAKRADAVVIVDARQSTLYRVTSANATERQRFVLTGVLTATK